MRVGSVFDCFQSKIAVSVFNKKRKEAKTSLKKTFFVLTNQNTILKKIFFIHQ